MVNCNDFRTFKKERDRMCESVGFHVELCPFKINDVEWDCHNCEESCLVKVDFVIETVQKWSDNHPYGAKQEEFLKMFPNAPIDTYTKTVTICPKYLDKEFNCARQPDCSICKINYWLEEK